METKANAAILNTARPDALSLNGSASIVSNDSVSIVSNNSDRVSATPARVRRPRRQVYLRGCPHCGGDVRFARDIYGAAWQCLQCSREIRPAARPDTPAMPMPAVAMTPAPAAHATTPPPQTTRLVA